MVQPSIVQTWTPSERRATTEAAMAKTGDSGSWVSGAGVWVAGAGLFWRAGAGAGLRLTVACGADRAVVGRVIFAVSFLGSVEEAGLEGISGLPTGGAGAGAGAAGITAADGGLGGGTAGAVGAEGLARAGTVGAAGIDGGLGTAAGAPGIGSGFAVGGAGTAAADGAEGLGMEGTEGAVGTEGAAGTGGLTDGGVTAEIGGFGIAETEGGAGTAGLGTAIPGMAEGGLGMAEATGFGTAGTAEGFRPGGGGTTEAFTGTGLGGRLIIAASPEPGPTGAPSRRFGRTMRTVSFFGSDIGGSVAGLGEEKSQMPEDVSIFHATRRASTKRAITAFWVWRRFSA